MFEKLLSMVPYNPGLSHQLAFYGRRMHEEANIRRTGLVFLVLTFLVQFFAVLSPPQSTVASPDNDLVSGGISSAADAKRYCVNNIRGYKKILNYYGIKCSAFNNAETLTIHTSARNYYSSGHNPSPGVDTPVNIPGSTKIYWRKLSTWNQASWKVLRVYNQDNKVFYIIYECGNLVHVGIPSPAPVQTAEQEGGFGNIPETPTTPPPPPTSPPPTTPPPTTPSCPYNSSLPANSPLCFEACEYNGNIPATDSACKPCDKSVSSVDALACVDVHKTAANVTAGLSDANNTTAKAGDVITYTLFAENKGKAKVSNFVFQENMSDVMDYADITDLHGGNLNSSEKIVSWPARDIAAGETTSVQITVKVKDPIPQTPSSPTDPYHFDLVMTNVYGNTVNIKLPGTPAKNVEVAAAQLPNTGPGTTLLIGAIIVILAGYFYARASLLAKESSLALKESV